MFEEYKKEIEWGGKTLTLETGKIARQADGAVVITYGGTKVLCTAVGKKEAVEGVDFLPMAIFYQERRYAAGAFPGGFFKRESKPTDNEVLISRLIDRPLRPLFPKGFHNEVQIICTVLEYDGVNDPDVPAMIGASAALTISGMPFMGPIAGARVAYIEDGFILNPTHEEQEESSLDLFVAGTSDGVLMVESEASELSEEQMLQAVEFGHYAFQPVLEMIVALAESCAKDPWELPALPYDKDMLSSEVAKIAEAGLKIAYKLTDKQQRQAAIKVARDAVKSHFKEDDTYPDVAIGSAFKSLESEIVRQDLLKTSKRIDGRTTTDIRAIECEIGILDRCHGSALFTRGETQALVVATLGTGQDEQKIDGIRGEFTDRFMLHYNFPPYSVGEAGRLGPPGRREIGHGKLAWRALNPLMPKDEEFPYVIRLVSEITESNGSSSMASVCGGTLALMHAGVPLKKAVAGIAMGLVKEDNEFVVLSDILGDEDHLGDMDFKVAGTRDGITSLQMDLKITSINFDIMKQALAQAKEGRIHILGKIEAAINAPNNDVHELAPRIVSMKIDKEKIRDVIGTGGKIIREIIEVTGVKIDIDDDGNVAIASSDKEGLDKAREWIENIVMDVEAGVIYSGKVARIVDFGAFVTLPNGSDGLLHISKIANERIEDVSKVLSEGQEVFVKVAEVDKSGRMKLEMKTVNQETGQEIKEEAS